MAFLLGMTEVIDRTSRTTRLIATVFVLCAVLLSAANAAFRYSVDSLLWIDQLAGSTVFGSLVAEYSRHSNSLLEGQWYLFAGMVMLGTAWTLKVNEHVRVDVVYGAVGERTRTWIDLLGGLFFLLPICILMIRFTWPWFVEAWITNEHSSNAGGLPRWPVLLSLPVGFGLLALQGLSEIIKCLLALTCGYVREFAYEKPLQ